MTEILQFSKLLSMFTIQGVLMRYHMTVFATSTGLKIVLSKFEVPKMTKNNKLYYIY